MVVANGLTDFTYNATDQASGMVSANGTVTISVVDQRTAPTIAPTAAPTIAPTAAPTIAPTAAPTIAPTAAPTIAPTAATTEIGLDFQAANHGSWGNNLLIIIDTSNIDPDARKIDNTLFKLSVTDPSTKVTENYQNLSLDSKNPNYVAKVLQYESHLIRIASAIQQPPTARPKAGKYNPTGDGDDGDPITDDEVSPSDGQANKTGYWALEKADLFNLLVIPPYKYEAGDPLGTSTDPPGSTFTEVGNYCQTRRAILLVDSPVPG